jgi:hypothetical protein
MKKTSLLFALSAFSLLAITGCASAPKAPAAADGGKIQVQVLIDGGWSEVDTANPDLVNRRRQLVNFMRKSAVEQLDRSGYDASPIDSLGQYDAQSGSRLLTIQIEHYNAGSAAARLLVGFGAGAATLDTRATYKAKGANLFDERNSIASGRDWRKTVKKTNILIMRKMAAHGA